ncbi:competence/damage-inducible protein A [soil metagenome]
MIEPSKNPLLRARIISTGSEILQGLYADTNAQKLSQILFREGFRVVGHRAAPDDRELIAEAISESRHDCDLIVMTGGLGPTADDVNRDIIAEVFGVSLDENSDAVKMMRDRFAKRGIEMPAGNLVQAMIPRGAITLLNHWGTAPGFIVRGAPALIALPGPPKEWMPMLERAIADHFPALFANRPARGAHTLHIALAPESTVAAAVSDLFEARDGRELTILAARGVIRLRLIASGETSAVVAEKLAAFRELILARVGSQAVFSDGPEECSTARALFELLKRRGETLALAESCTGGGVGRAITEFAGSSAVLKAGWVTYSNESKMRELGVSESILAAHGAVSEETARAMAEGARRVAGTTHAIAVTGIAGPDGGSEEKPVGTVWFAVACPGGTVALRRRFNGDRAFIREMSETQACEFLRRKILGIDPELLIGGVEPKRAA